MLLYVEIDKEQNVISVIQSNEIQEKDNVHKVPEKYLYSYYLYRKFNPNTEEFYEKIPNVPQYFKTDYIKGSKESLKVWLEQNPLFSKVHNPDGEYYSVTEDKQLLLSQEILFSQLSSSHKCMWNCKCGIKEEWTLNELSSLNEEIRDYVLPRVITQQKYESLVLSCEDYSEVNNISFDYNKCEVINLSEN